MRTGLLTNVLIGSAAVLAVGAKFLPGTDQSGPVLTKAVAFVSSGPLSSPEVATSTVSSRIEEALRSIGSEVRPLSHPAALEDAFRAYFVYRTAHTADVKKPYLYFVDYGLSSTTPRGYVFDMDVLKIVDGPFTVAHGRGSASSQYGVPTHFSNASGSKATSLGLYLTQSTYGFHGHTGGQSYSSIGLQLLGLSDGFNTNAQARRVVVHGAPYVTATRAGRSEGCPAMEPSRANLLLPKLANGSMVFLFAPNQQWMAGDPWVAASTQ
jgi:L,D-transpeptidase catalytic domain